MQLDANFRETTFHLDAGNEADRTSSDGELQYLMIRTSGRKARDADRTVDESRSSYISMYIGVID